MKILYHMTYVLQCMAWRQQHWLGVRRLEDAEIFGFRPSRMDGIKNEQNRGTAKVERFGDKV